eukprot:1158918-Pelagomonas_calceolata.AAC.5
MRANTHKQGGGIHICVSWQPACLLPEGKNTQTHSLQDGLPCQVELGLVVLDVDTVEPVLDGVEGLGGDGVDAQDLEGIHEQSFIGCLQIAGHGRCGKLGCFKGRGCLG